MQKYFERPIYKSCLERDVKNGLPKTTVAILESFDAFCKSIAEEAIENNEGVSLDKLFKPAENANARLINELSGIALYYACEVNKANDIAYEQAHHTEEVLPEIR